MTAAAHDTAAASAGGRRRAGPLSLTAPATLGMLVFFVAPLVTFVVYSFLTAGIFSVSGPLTFSSYTDAIHAPASGRLAMNSFVVGILAAGVSLAVALPIAYWLRYHAGGLRIFVLFLITATLFASYLVRIYAWRSILGENGLLNDGLERLGVIDQPLG